MISKWLWQRKKAVYTTLFCGVFITLFTWVLFPTLTQPFYWDTYGFLMGYARDIAGNILTSPTFNWSILLSPGSDYPHTFLVPLVYSIIYSVSGTYFILNAHIFGFFISLVLLGVLFFGTQRLSDTFTATIATIFVAFDPLFLAQTGLVYFEIPSLLLRIISIYALLNKRKRLFIFFSILSFLVRFENGFILAATAFVWLLSRKGQFFSKLKMFFEYSWLLVFVSISWILLYVNEHGWLINPGFGFEVHRAATIYKFLEDAFFSQGRLVFTISSMAFLPFIIRDVSLKNTQKLITLFFIQGLLTILVIGVLGNTLMRYVLPLLPLIYLLFSLTVSFLRKKNHSLVAYTLVGFGLFMQVNNWYSCMPNFEECLSYEKWIQTKIQIAGEVGSFLPANHLLLTDWDFADELVNPQISGYKIGLPVNAIMLDPSNVNNDKAYQHYVLVTPNTLHTFEAQYRLLLPMITSAEKSGMVVRRWGDGEFESTLYKLP